MKISNYIPAFSPYLIGALIYHTLLEGSPSAPYITAYMLFILFFSLWHCLRTLVAHWHSGTRKEKGKSGKNAAVKKPGISSFAMILLFGFLTLAVFESLRTRTPPIILYLVVALMGITALTDSFRERKAHRSWVAAKLLSVSAICFTGIQIGLPVFVWQGVPFSIAIACATVSHELAPLLCSGEIMGPAKGSAAKRQDKEKARPSRNWLPLTYSLLLLLGPGIILTLTYLRLLPMRFLGVALIMPFFAPLIASARSKELKQEPLPPSFIPNNTGVSVLFFVTITLLSIL